MSGRLQGKVVCVTGAGRGIGREVALQVATLGGGVVVADYGGAVDTSDAERVPVAEEVVREIRAAGGEAVATGEDVSTMAGGEQIVRAAIDAFGRIDAMVCCAGILIESDLLHVTEAEWDRAAAVHLKGHFSCMQAATRQMLDQGAGGRLVFFASSTALAGSPDRPAYAAMKAGVMGLALSCAAALEGSGITSNCVVPRAATRMTDHVVTNLSETPPGQLPSEAAKNQALDPANIAPVVAYLLTDEAAGINGQVFGSVGYQMARLAPATWSQTLERDRRWTVDDLAEAVPQTFGSDLGYRPFHWEYTE